MTTDHEAYAEAIAVVVRGMMADRGLGLREACRLAGVTPQTVLGMGGTPAAPARLPSVRTLLSLAVVLGTTPGSILMAAEAAMEAES